MTAIRRSALFSAAGAMLVAATLPASVNAAVEKAEGLPQLSYDLASYSPSEAQPAAEAQPALSVDKASLDCMAKVVHHESRGQPRRGMIAVAQTLLNRVKIGGRFGDSVCAVANQPGQYFNTASYHPNQDSSDWQTAVDVSRAALDGSAEDAAHGALFFHAAYRAPSGFFRSRQRVSTIGGQVFYR